MVRVQDDVSSNLLNPYPTADNTPSAATDGHTPQLTSTTPTRRRLVWRVPMSRTCGASTPMPMKGANTSPATLNNPNARHHQSRRSIDSHTLYLMKGVQQRITSNTTSQQHVSSNTTTHPAPSLPHPHQLRNDLGLHKLHRQHLSPPRCARNARFTHPSATTTLTPASRNHLSTHANSKMHTEAMAGSNAATLGAACEGGRVKCLV